MPASVVSGRCDQRRTRNLVIPHVRNRPSVADVPLLPEPPVPATPPPGGAASAFRRHRAVDDPHARESIVYMAHDVEIGVTVAAYTWVNAAGEVGCSAAYFHPDRTRQQGHPDAPFPDSADFDSWQVGPLTMRQGSSSEPAEVAWEGGDFSFSLTFTPMHAAYSYGDAPHGCPPFVATDRVEQAGVVELTTTVDGTSRSVTCTGHRDHSWGVRDWQMMQHYRWIEAQAGSTAIHLFEIDALGRRLLHGYVFRDGDVATIVDADVEVTLDDQLFPTAVALSLRDSHGRETAVTAREQARVELHVSKAATLVDTTVAVEIDGQAGGGYVDLLWPPDYLAHVRSRPSTGR